MKALKHKGYSPIPYNHNKENKRFVESSGDLDRIIYETGIRMIFEGITDVNQIEFYTLTEEEKCRVFSSLADRFWACNSPFSFVTSKLTRKVCLHEFGMGGPFGDIKLENQVVIDLYKKACSEANQAVAIQFF